MIKLMPVLAGAIALSVTAAPLAVKAEPTLPNQLLLAQAQKQPRRMAGVELTQAQQAKIAEIRRNTRSQMEEVLTPEQRQQFKAAMQNRQGRQAAMAAANISPEQQTLLREIWQSTKSQIDAVLTPQQRQQIEQNKQQWLQQRQQRQQQNQ